jgi:hypothetical protein
MLHQDMINYSKQSSDLTKSFVCVWLALVNKRTKLLRTHRSTLETDLWMKDLPPCGRTTMMRTCYSISSLASPAKSGQRCSHASQLLVWVAGRPEQEGTWHGGSVGRRPTSTRARPWSPPIGELRSSSHSISLPQVPTKKTSSTNLKEHVMVSSITLVTEHVMLTSLGISTRTHGHEY